MKFITFFLLLASWSPYLFLATSVEDVPMSDRAFDCTVRPPVDDSDIIGFETVYYQPFKGGFSNNKRIILPDFFRKSEAFYATCADAQFFIGHVNFVKPYDQIHATTQKRVLKLFSYKLLVEEGINSFGTGWQGKREGETILKKLVNDKEVKMFGGKVIK